MYKPVLRHRPKKITALSSVPIDWPTDICVSLPFSERGFLLIEKSVIEKICTYRQSDNHTPESGGCLLGYFRPPHIHITDITVPMGEDEQSRIRFHRKDKRHLVVIKKFTEKTKTGTYIGEWHTHPECFPTPSGIDTHNWEKILSIRQPTKTFFLIAGTSSIAIYSI